MAHLAVPAKGSGPPVLIIHSWWGLTGSFTTLADRLADAGFLAGCVDLYRGQIAATEQQARALRSARRREPVYQTLRHSLTQLGQHPAAVRPDAAVIGFSMGGHWAVWLAQHPPPTIAATVLFYTARAGDYRHASSPVLAHFAGTDEFVSDSARNKMERAIARAGLAYSAYDYPDTTHWFAETEHDAYDKTSTEQALLRTIGFLTRRPGQG